VAGSHEGSECWLMVVVVQPHARFTCAMYEQSSDPQVREMAKNQVLRLDAVDQMDILRKILATFQTRNARCITSWKELQVEFRTLRIPVDPTGAPLDPSRTPYVLGANCNVQLSPQSEVPKR
jgi:hypothetical protein